MSEAMEDVSFTHEPAEPMPTSKRTSNKRPAPQYLYAGASKWTSAEYEFLNVDDEVKPWRDILNIQTSDKDLRADENVQNLLGKLHTKARNYTTQEINSMCDSTDVATLYLGEFYEAIRTIVMATQHNDFEKTMLDSTPSPKEIKRIRYDRAAKSSYISIQGTIPKSSSLQSISSVSSDEQGAREGLTRQAFFSLLHYIRRICSGEFAALSIKSQPFVGSILLKPQPKPVRVENDGSIVLRNSSLGDLPFLNIECKSRAGSSSLDVYEKIFAQEFGESLAIMLARLKAMEGMQERPSYTVYSIGVHHRRAYLARVDFDPGYLEDCVNGTLNERRVTVTRSERNYRLDDVTELQELVIIIYCLCRQFVTEIRAGRLA